MTQSIIVDDRAFRAAYSNLLTHIGQEVRNGVRRYGASVVTFSVAHIHSVSGDLESAMRTEDHLDESPPYLVVGAFETDDHPHSVETEYGTSKEEARPFFRPALDEAVRDFTVTP